jgi:zinc carboxypeptidase
MRTRCAAIVAGVLATIALAAAPAQAAPIPAPAQYFGFELGTTGKLAHFSKLQAYYQLIADRSNRVEYQNLGETVLGHDYPFMLASAPQNLQRVDQILADNARLANPRGLTPEAARELAARNIPVYYLEAGMHSSEVGPVQAMGDIVYRLATDRSPEITRILDEMLIVIVPAANPDGAHLTTDYFNETEGTDFDRTYPDLYHWYTGHDDNRDWLFFTQPESKIRIGIFRQYRPVLEHILHQAGSGNPRMWTPPWDDPLGSESPRDSIQVQSSNALGLQVNRGLVAQDKKGVKWGNAYGIFHTADIASFETFMGSGLLLFEAASVRDYAFPFTSSNGGPIGEQTRTMRNTLPYDKSEWRLEQIVDYIETGTWLALDAVSREPERWSYENLYLVPRNAINSQKGPYAYVLPADQRDPYAVYDLLRIFDQSLVEIDRATAPFTAGGETYPAGSYVLTTRQPLGKWVDQLLDDSEYPDEARNCSQCPLLSPYSEATDSVHLMLGVDADPIAAPFSAQLDRVEELAPDAVTMPLAPPREGAYLVEPDSYGVARFLADLQQADVPVFRSSEPFSAGGRDYAPGTLVVPPSARSRSVLAAAATETGLAVFAADQAPQVDGFELKPGTRVGLIRGADNMPGGWLMWQLDQHEVDYEVVEADHYGDLSARYDTILLPDGISRNRIVQGLDPDEVPERFHWARGVGDAGWTALAAFVRDGGTLVALGSSSETARQLLNLPVQRVQPPDPFEIPGSLMRVRSNLDVPELWGMPERWNTWFDNDAAFRVLDASAATAGTTYPDDGDPLLGSGYAAGADALRGLADVVTFDVGDGHVVIAGTDLNFRTWPRVAWTVVANAIYHGPSERVTAED